MCFGKPNNGIIVIVGQLELLIVVLIVIRVDFELIL